MPFFSKSSLVPGSFEKNMKHAAIMIVDFIPASGLSSILQGILSSCPFTDIQLYMKKIEVCENSLCDKKLQDIISRVNPHVIFLIISSMQFKQPDTFMRFIDDFIKRSQIIIVAEESEPNKIVELFKIGIADFITPPLKSIDILPRIWRLLERKRINEVLVHSLKEKNGLKQIVGESPVFVKEIEKIPMIAKCNFSVLISGETGTGKELCARAIHYLSPRSGKPFIPVNCGAIPIDLFENELFGHMKGAFTGAAESYSGLIHEANGGTLFLDEIGCLPLQIQVKLLRFLQDKEYRQLGCSKFHQADVGIIAASNLDLERAVSEKKFRQDLFYRLNIIPLTLPPLRDRKDDIPILARYFTDNYALEFDKQVKDFTAEALNKLVAYNWPGNIRELENVLKRALVFSEQTIIQDSDIVLPRYEIFTAPESFKAQKAKTIAEFDKNYIQGLLLANHGNISKAAKAANKDPRALRALIRKHEIDVQNFKTTPR